MSQKFLQITPDILLEWDYSTGKVTENYTKLTNVSSGKVNFMSTTSSKNDVSHTLFTIDPIVRKMAKVDTTKFNFLQSQNYFTSPIEYDTIKVHFSSEYNFDENIGFLLSIYTFDYEHNKYIYFSDFYYDKTDLYSERSMNLQIPFLYGEKEWNRNITISVPSINEVGKQREVNSSRNIAFPFTINANMSTNGISDTSPILVDFCYINGSETVLGQKYYFMGDLYRKSVPRIPQYQSLGVMVRESPEWDFFEIYGYYNNSNENLDNFVNELESKGRKIKIEYTVTLYEENIRSGYPITYSVDENFSQKIEFRPVFKFSNTTAAIDVQMDVIDLVDYSVTTRRATLGLTKNLFKYGKKLLSFNVSNTYKPKIYNYKPSPSFSYDANSNSINYTITKVPYPVLNETYKILVNASNTTNTRNEFKTLGLTTLILSPFDNIIKFQIYEQKDNNSPEPYKISDALVYGKLLLIFKSDTEEIKKEMFYESDQNKLDYGVVVFKVNENDINSIKRMVRDKKDNFYLVLEGYKTKTMLYSGKVKIFENLTFPDFKGGSWTPYIPIPQQSGITDSVVPLTKVNIDDIIKNQFDEKNLAIKKSATIPSKEKSPGEIFLNDYNNTKSKYSNYIIFVKSADSRPGATQIIPSYEKFMQVKTKIESGQYGVNSNNIFYYNTNLSIIVVQKAPKENFNQFVLQPTSLDTAIESVIEMTIGLGLDPNLLRSSANSGIIYDNGNQINQIQTTQSTLTGPPSTSIELFDRNNNKSNIFGLSDAIKVKLSPNSSNIDETTKCSWEFNVNNSKINVTPSSLENKKPTDEIYISYTQLVDFGVHTSAKIKLTITNSRGTTIVNKNVQLKKIIE